MKKIKLFMVTMLAALAMVVTLGTTSVFANNIGNSLFKADPVILDGVADETFLDLFGRSYLYGVNLGYKDTLVLKNNGIITYKDRTVTLDVEFVISFENVEVDFVDLGRDIDWVYDDNDISWDNSKKEFDIFKLEYLKNGDYRINGLYIDSDLQDHSFELSFKPIYRGDSVPAIRGQHTVINNIDNPYTEARIRDIAGLKAIDSYYGDISDDIVVVRDDYTANKSKVGTFEIEYKVTNESGLSSTFILLVANKDITKPVIQGPGISTMSYTEEFVLSNLMAKFTVTDNYDENVPLVKESDNHVAGVPGTYQFKFSATDISKNSTTFTHTLNVIDDIRPIFTDINDGVLEVNWRDKVTDEVFLLGLSAHDEIDGDRTEHIKIIENNQHNNAGKTYTVKYEVADKAGNKAQLTRTYKVITTDNPVFWVSKNLLLISDVNSLTPEQIADELARYEGINMASFSFIENDYENNENYAGEYTIKLAINDVHGTEHIIERTMMVFEESEMPTTELSIWQKIWNVVVSIFTWIKNAFVWVWELIKKIVMFIPNLIKGKEAAFLFIR